MTMPGDPYWGNIFKSSSNGTYFSFSAANVNRNNAGYVNFEKVVGLNELVVLNTVAKTGDAKTRNTRCCRRRSRITMVGLGKLWIRRRRIRWGISSSVRARDASFISSLEWTEVVAAQTRDGLRL